MNRLWTILKNNIMYSILSLLIISITLALFIKEDKELVIISRAYPYSVYHTDLQEKVPIEILTNKRESYHFSPEYIIDAKIYNSEEELSVLVDDIKISNDYVMYQDQSFYQVIFSLALPFSSNDLLISIEEAHLEVTYDNLEKINIKIGDFVYLFDENFGTDITLGNLSATHEVIKGYNTIGGVNLDLTNRTDNNIMITDVLLLSNSVYFNKEEISKLISCEYDTSVSSCLGLESYDFKETFIDTKLSILLGRGNNLELFIPLLYEEDMDFIHEFSIVVTYEINNREKVFIIDDFPYMKRSIFTEFYEDDFYVYTYAD